MRLALPSHSGVYVIECLGNDRIYIGSAQNIRQRAYQHFCRLRCRKHKNPKLQQAFNKYGESSFVIYVIEKCALEAARLIEKYWIVALDAVRRGFNVVYDTFAPMQGRKFSLKSRLKMSESHKRITGEQSHWWGKHRSDITKSRISATKRAASSTMRGINHTNSRLNPEAVLEIRNRYTEGRLNPNNSVALAREFKVSKPSILNVISGKTWKHII